MTGLHAYQSIKSRNNRQPNSTLRLNITEFHVRVMCQSNILQHSFQVTQIQKEQNFQRFREERFRYTSESTNSKVFWWATVQVSYSMTVLFCLVGRL